MLVGMNDIPARSDLDVTTPILRSQPANDMSSDASGLLTSE